MALTLKYMFKQKVTLNYPYEKGPLSPRFRRTRFAVIPTARNATSPANFAKPFVGQAITIEADLEAVRTTRYDIDMVKCICGTKLPVDAIVDPNESPPKPARTVLTRKLLANGDQWAELADRIRTRRTADCRKDRMRDDRS